MSAEHPAFEAAQESPQSPVFDRIKGVIQSFRDRFRGGKVTQQEQLPLKLCAGDFIGNVEIVAATLSIDSSGKLVLQVNEDVARILDDVRRLVHDSADLEEFQHDGVWDPEKMGNLVSLIQGCTQDGALLHLSDPQMIRMLRRYAS